MVSLLEGIKNFFSDKSSELHERRVENKIRMISMCGSVKCIEQTWTSGPIKVQEDDRVITAKDARITELTAQGMLTPTDQVLGIFKPLPAALFAGFSELRNTIESTIGTTLEAALKPGSPEVTKVYAATTDFLIQGILNALDPGQTKISGQLRKELTNTMDPLLRLGLTFTVGSALAELIHPTKELGLSHVSHFLYDTVGFKALMESYINPLRLNLIEQPTKYSINELTTPFLPTQGEITGLARKYEITEAKFHDAMSKQGIGKEWRDALYNGFWADPRLFEILRLMEVELPPAAPPAEASAWLTRANMTQYVGPNWWLAMKFGKAGYDQIDIPVLIKVVRARNRMKELGDIRTLNRNIYKDGGYTRAEYEAQLAKRGISKEEAKELIDAIDKELAEELNKEFRRAIEQKYRYGRLTDEELVDQLTKHGLIEARAKARAAYLLEMRTGKLTVAEEEVKDLTRAEILKAYRVGEKEKGWALKRIDDAGYTTEDAVTLVNTEEKGLIEDVNAEWIRAYEQRTLNLRMEPAELEKEYIKLGKSEEWAKARAAYFEERVLGKEKIA